MDDEFWPSLLEFPTDPPVIHAVSDAPVWLLNIVFGVSGLFWTTAWLLCIRRAHREKLIAAPYVSVGINITWNFVYAFVFHIQGVQDIVTLVYFLIECVLLAQVFRYGAKESSTLSRSGYHLMIVGMLVFGLCFHIAAGWDFADQGGYTGFGTTTLTSLAFLLMLQQRRSTAGQSMYIGVSKLVGSVLASTGFALLYPTRMLMWVFYLTMLVLDALYVVLLYRRFRREGVSPWRKV